VVNDNGVGFRAENHPANAQEVADEIVAAGGKAVGSDASAATSEGAASIVRLAIDTFGRVDILVNNAGVLIPALTWDFTDEQWDFVVDTTLKGYYQMIREVSPLMCEQRSGVIVNISSKSGFGHPTLLPYAAAKEGVIGLTRTVAKELGRFGVRCNAIRPTANTYLADVTYIRNAPPEFIDLMVATGDAALLHGLSTPGEPTPGELHESRVSALVAWLCTDTASNVNGRTFQAGGDAIGLYREQQIVETLIHEGGWTLDALDEVREQFVGELKNPFTLDDRPELQKYES
jgi:NAD(P)-dependent dehydrogenase (short-subunit alcohol dehydrogenase family)